MEKKQRHKSGFKKQAPRPQAQQKQKTKQAEKITTQDDESGSNFQQPEDQASQIETEEDLDLEENVGSNEEDKEEAQMDDHNIGEQDGSDSGAGGSQDNDNMEDDEESKGNLDADEQLASLLQIDKSSHKDKLRKVTDFKFRVMDLLEIIIKKTTSQEVFMKCLEQLIESVNCLTREKQKNLSDKLCSILKTFIDRNQKISPEYKENMDKCIVKLINDLAKSSSKKVNKTYNYSLFVLLKIRMNNFEKDQDFIKLMKEQLSQALQKTALKRDISYNSQFYREFFKNYPEISNDLIPHLFKFINFQNNGGSREYNKKLILDTLLMVLVNGASKPEILTQLEASREFVKLAIEGPVKHFQQIKKKRYAILHKYADILIKYCERVQNNEDIKICLKQVLEHWESLNDKNLKGLQKRLEALAAK